MQNVKNKHGVISHLDVVFAIRVIKTHKQMAKKHGRSPHMSLVPIPNFRVHAICKQILSAEGLNLDANAYNFNYAFGEYYDADFGVNYVSGFHIHITPKKGDKMFVTVGHYADFKKSYSITANRDDNDLSELSLPIDM